MKISIFVAFIYIIAFNFQNIFLKEYIGTIGASGLTVLFPITIILILFNLEKIKIYKLEKKLIYFLLYMIVISCIESIYLILKYDILTFYSENLIIKSCKLVFYNVVSFLSITVLSRLLNKISNKNISIILNINFLLIFLVFLFERVNNVGRLKLLSSEPSEAGFVVTIFFLLGVYYNRFNKKNITIYLSLFLIVTSSIGSKGTIICLLGAIILVLLLKIDFKNKIRYFPVFVILGIIYYIIYFNSLKIGLLNDLNYFTSIITRGFSLLTGINVFMRNILGVSGGYLYYFSKEGQIIYNYLFNLYPTLNYSEILSYLNSGKNLNPKSGIFMDLVLYGVYSIYFYIWLFKYYYKNLQKDKILLVLIIYLYLSLMIYIDKYMTPTYVLVLAFLESKIRKEDRNKI